MGSSRRIEIGVGGRLPADFQEQFRLTQEIVYGYTVPIVVDAPSSDGFGTGVVIEIGPRWFVASAGHVVKCRPCLGLGREVKFSLPLAETNFLSREYIDDEFFDIGFIEIQPNLHHSACPFDALSDIELPLDLLVMLVGHPLDAPDSLRDSVKKQSIIRSWMKTAHVSQLKEVVNDRYTFLFSGNMISLDGDTGRMTQGKGLATPEGFSGGGIWGFRDAETVLGLLTPANMIRLFALEYSWRRNERVYNATPIKYWLKLIHNHYEDLRPLIESRFPSICEVAL